MIRYSTPSRDPEKPETKENRYDTPDTIKDIDEHNNVLIAQCPALRPTPR